jgi:uncharacterized protein (TIGR00369 family)
MVEREGPFWEWAAGRSPGPPGTALLGWKCRQLDTDAGIVAFEFNAKPDFTNAMGAIQGGYLAAVFDDALGAALFATVGHGHFTPTVELKVNYIRPARPGLLVGQTRVVHKGRSLAFLSGELSTPEGDLIATATATARIVRVQ